MNIFDVISLFGGLAMFLYGMRLMGDSLKENSSGALKTAMEKVTNNPFKAFFLGLFVTALIQSSTATIVITAGLVGAGILTLRQSLGIIIGANVGTTVTGQIIRLLDVDASGAAWLQVFQPSTLAPLALIFGMILIMGNFVRNSKSVGNIAIGFGILFSGLLNMTGAVDALAESGIIGTVFLHLGENHWLGYITGAGIAFVLQSSSAAVGILQAFSASGMLTFKAIYPVIVGIYLGDCVTTAIVIYIGAKAEPKRVAIVNILFNLCETVVVLAVVAIVHKLGLLDAIWDQSVTSGVIANTNTVFNIGCAVLLFPLIHQYERLSRRIVKDDPEPEDRYKEELNALNPAFFDTPALALRSCHQLLLTTFTAARENIQRSLHLLAGFDDGQFRELMEEEEQIDRLTDRISSYIVALLPRLKLEYHISILNQYYKVTTEFERLGDHAVQIAETAAGMQKDGTKFSETAMSELRVLEAAIEDILADTEQAFRKRDLEAANRIEPKVQLVGEIVSQLRNNHLHRMSIGQCNVYADVSFSNLMVEFRRIAGVCSNVGVATVVRVHPELADHEHLYFESLHAGGDEDFNKVYQEAYDRFFTALTGKPAEG